MPVWSTSCPDWKTRIRERRTLIPFTPLFPASAEAKMDVFKSLKIADLGINPATDETWTIGESADDWLLDFAAAIFGAYNAETGEQLIREGLLLVSKKNTKSTIAAGIMLTELICGWVRDLPVADVARVGQLLLEHAGRRLVRLRGQVQRVPFRPRHLAAGRLAQHRVRVRLLAEQP